MNSQPMCTWATLRGPPRRVATPASARKPAALWQIEGLPEGEREAFDLVRIQGMSQSEAARVLGVSVMTVHRRLGRGLQRLASTLGDLYPGEETPGTS